MKNLKNMKNYGPWEWVALLMGLILITYTVRRFLLGHFDEIASWADTGILIVPLGAIVLGGMLIGVPMKLLDLFRGLAGMTTRETKIWRQEKGIDPQKEIE